MPIDFQNYRTGDIDRNLQHMGIEALDVAVVGVTGAGKSTTLNAFFQKTVAKEGEGVDPETMKIGDYALNSRFRIWDTPGLGDSPAQDESHKQAIIQLLRRAYDDGDSEYGQIDMVLVILDASSRDMGVAYQLLNEVLIPNMPKERILVLMNQADFAMRTAQHWNFDSRTPDATLKAFLEEKADSIQRRVKEATGLDILRPVYYSAKYGYHIREAFDFIIDHMPLRKRAFHRPVSERAADVCAYQLKAADTAESCGILNHFEPFQNHQYFLETRDYLVFCRVSRFNATYRNKPVDSTDGLFRVHKHTGKVERVALDYQRDLTFNNRSFLAMAAYLSFCVYENTIYFINNFASQSEETRLIAVDVAHMTCTLMPSHIFSKLACFHITRNESCMLICAMVEDALPFSHNHADTKIYLIDLSQNNRVFLLEPDLDVSDMFLWKGECIVWGRKKEEKAEYSLFKYDIAKKSAVDFFDEQPKTRDFDWYWSLGCAVCGGDITGHHFRMIHSIQRVNSRFYFLTSVPKGSGISSVSPQCYYFSVFNPLKPDEYPNYANFPSSYDGQSPVIPMDDKALCFSWGFGMVSFDFNTLKTVFLDDGNKNHPEYFLFGDYLYREISHNEWQKANIRDGLSNLQWEILP